MAGHEADSEHHKTLVSESVFAWAVTLAFASAVACAAFMHAMWRDEWVPLVIARDTSGYAEFFSEIRYLGRNGFFSFVWLLDRLGGLVLFKIVLVAISTLGVYLFARWAPFSRPLRAMFAFGYYPLYEYGTILRDYGSILTLCVAAAVLLGRQGPRPLLMGLTLALLAQTNAFGAVLATVIGAVFLLDLWKRGLLSRPLVSSRGFLAGAAVAFASLAVAGAGFVQPPDVTRAVLGSELRTDSHVVRLLESLPFPLRAWFPIPAFGTWNSQLLDPWPMVQIAAVVGLTAWLAATVWHSFTARCMFGLGMVSMIGILCHLPWTALRYHGPYLIVLLMSLWLVERDERWMLAGRPLGQRWSPFAAAITAAGGRRGFLAAVLAVHVVVGLTFVAQERLVPFSGSAMAARVIREREPADVLVVVDPDYAAISLAGCLSRPVYIAARDEPGSFTKVDPNRRLGRLPAEELSGVLQRQLQREGRDIVLVTNYEIGMPPELGMLLGVTPSITDERYYIFRIRHRSGRP